ncbi:hypothetical protein GCM10029992_43090 [Glycomyces albus]
MTDPEMISDRERPAIRVERHYDHPIDRVWRAVTEPASLSAWFPFEAEFELRPGGRARFGGDDGMVGEVLAVDPPRHLAFTWEGDRFEFDLREEGGGTRFVLTHGFDDRAGAASFATGWEKCMDGLSEVLVGRNPGETDRGVERHEELVTRFGIDRPRIERTAEGWHARFERQLTCPAQTAWNLFFGTDEGRSAPGVGEEFRAPKAPEILLGTVTEADEPNAFAIAVAEEEPGDQLRLRFGEGTGHGARLFLEVSGSASKDLDAAVEQWGEGAIAHVAREGARLAMQDS